MIVFAIHPLRVESVAWATERRDVLSGLFYVLTVLCYLRYASLPLGAGGRRGWYVTTLLVYVLAVLSKGTTVSLPIVLLILDVYPLRRLVLRVSDRRPYSVERVVLEKVPFFILALTAGLIALVGQAGAGAMMELARHGVGGRIAVAFYGLAFYLVKTVWPGGLSPFYELPPDLRPLLAWLVAAVALVAAVTAAAVWGRSRRPWIASAWAAYVVMILPMLGLVQVGAHLVADRYSYLPGLSLALVAGAGTLALWRRLGEVGEPRLIRPAAAVPIALTIVLVPLTRQQCTFWANDLALWTRVLQIDPKSAVGHYNLALVLEKVPEWADRAEESYRQAVSCKPDYLIAWQNLGNLMAMRGKDEQAVACYHEVLKREPKFVDVRANLMVVLTRLGKYDEAIEQAREALRIDPGHVGVHNNLGLALRQKGRLEDALESFRKAIEINPCYPPAYENLCGILLAQRRYAELVDILRKAIKHMPDHIELGNMLAWVLATCPRDDVRNGPEAVQLALRVCQRTRMNNHVFLDTLAAAYAEIGAYDKAAQTLQQAIDLVSVTNPVLASRYRERQREHLAGRPRRSE